MRLNLLLSLTLLTLPVLVNSQDSMTAEEYINKFKVLAVQEMIAYHIPASITLAQGLVETANGNSNLARLANNHFGIKCHKGWTGATYIQDDDEADECFRKYDSPEASYRDHSLFLTTRPRYAELFTLDLTDYKGWAKGLKSAGYATSSTYTDHLIKVIEENNLFAYDTLTSIPASWSSEPFFVDNLDVEGGEPMPEGAEFLIHPKRDYQIKLFNRIKYVEAKTGDTPKQIAEGLDLMVWQVCKYNDISKTYVFKTGEKVYLQPKRNKGTAPRHTFKEGESMRDVSQLYGIKLSKLYSKNSMKPGLQPEPGTILELQKKKK